MSDGIIRICAVAIMCVAVSVVGRGFSGAIHTAIRIAGAVILFSCVMLCLSDAVLRVGAIVGRFAEGSRISEMWEIMLRALGVAVLCKICTEVCRDCGEGAIANGVETAGKITILVLSLPLVEEIISCAEELLTRI